MKTDAATHVLSRAAGDKLRSAPPGIDEFLSILGERRRAGMGRREEYVRAHRNAADRLEHIRHLTCPHANSHGYL